MFPSLESLNTLSVDHIYSWGTYLNDTHLRAVPDIVPGVWASVFRKINTSSSMLNTFFVLPYKDNMLFSAKDIYGAFTMGQTWY